MDSTQRAFRRVYEHVKWTSDEKVMIVRSWNNRAHSLLSSARRAPPRRSAQPHTAHAEELSTSGKLTQLMQKSSAQEVSSCRRAQHSSCRRAQPQLMQESSSLLMQESSATTRAEELSTAHAEELRTARAEELSHSSCRRAHHSSCRRAQP